MNRSARAALAVGFVTLFLASGTSAAHHGTLSLVSRQPLALQGQGFARGESVHVVVSASATVARDVSASSSGAFRVRFARVNVQRCGGLLAHARGGAGTVAALKIPLPACMPTAEP